MRSAVVALCLSIPISASAQTTGEQQAADIASWVVMGAAVTVDVASCRDRHCLVMAGIRNATVAGATYGLKHAIRSARPCAPECSGPYQNIPSGHVAFTAATLPMGEPVGYRIVVAGSATGLVALLRGKANKHDAVGMATGAVVGWAASWIR